MVLKLVAKSLLEENAKSALIITPRHYSSIAQLLRDSIMTELKVDQHSVHSVKQNARDCLEKVKLSSVFDIAGVEQTLSELHWSDSYIQPLNKQASVSDRVSKPDSSPMEREGAQATVLTEVGDSDEEELSQQSNLTTDSLDAEVLGERARQGIEPLLSPDIIVITHFSTFLTTLFTERERAAAHRSLLLLKSRLHFLSRSLDPSPLVVILNSTSVEQGPGGTDTNMAQLSGTSSANTSLGSIFSLPNNCLPGYNYSCRRRIKPSFGLIFSQLLDLHILSTNIPGAYNPKRRGHLLSGEDKPSSPYTVVEVLLDEAGSRGTPSCKERKSREQRWCVCANLCSGRE